MKLELLLFLKMAFLLEYMNLAVGLPAWEIPACPPKATASDNLRLTSCNRPLNQDE